MIYNPPAAELSLKDFGVVKDALFLGSDPVPLFSRLAKFAGENGSYVDFSVLDGTVEVRLKGKAEIDWMTLSRGAFEGLEHRQVFRIDGVDVHALLRGMVGKRVKLRVGFER
jgi:hypothetical protein